jgi:hypothetical protein
MKRSLDLNEKETGCDITNPIYVSDEDTVEFLYEETVMPGPEYNHRLMKYRLEDADAEPNLINFGIHAEMDPYIRKMVDNLKCNYEKERVNILWGLFCQDQSKYIINVYFSLII